MSFWLLLKCCSLKIPPLRKRIGNLKIALVWETTHFCPGNRLRLTVILQHKGTLRAASEGIRQLPSAAPVLTPSWQLHYPKNARLQMPQDRLGPAMNCFPWARLSDFIQLSKGRGTTANRTSADDQLFDVNRAKKLQITWGFPGFLPHCCSPISKCSTREMSSQMSFRVLCFFAGISAGPFDELYMEVSTFGICC